MVVERNDADFMAEKWGDGWAIRDDKIGSFIAAARVAPRSNLIEKIVADGHCFVRGRVEELGKRKDDTRCKDGDQQDGSADRGEPFWRQSREEKNQELISGNGQPEYKDVQPIGDGSPSGGRDERL